MTNETFISSVDVGKKAVEDRTKQLEPKWRIDDERYNAFIKCLGDVDFLKYDNDGTSVEVRVRDKCICIILECPSMTAEPSMSGTYDSLIRLLEQSDRTEFYSSLSGDLRVSFEFGSIWKLLP